MECLYGEYLIVSRSNLLPNGRYSISCEISKYSNGIRKAAIFYDDNKIAMLLKEESENESINFGKNIIKNDIIEF